MRNSRILPVCLMVLMLAGCGSPSRSGNREMIADGVSAKAPRILGVNAYLWQAALDTLSFLPLASVDPFGGVIISDWYLPPASPGERIKVTVHVMDRALSADGLKVTVFRQERKGADWQYAPAHPDTARQLEDSILTRARELRLHAQSLQSS
jgi:hypothetical protein